MALSVAVVASAGVFPVSPAQASNFCLNVMVDSEMDCPTWCSAQDPSCKNLCNARYCSRYPAPTVATDCPSLGVLSAAAGLTVGHSDALTTFATGNDVQVDVSCKGPGKTNLLVGDVMRHEVETTLAPGKYRVTASFQGVGTHERVTSVLPNGDLLWDVSWKTAPDRLVRVAVDHLQRGLCCESFHV